MKANKRKIKKRLRYTENFKKSIVKSFKSNTPVVGRYTIVDLRERAIKQEIQKSL